jgi:hypothetical protein
MFIDILEETRREREGEGEREREREASAYEQVSGEREIDVNCLFWAKGFFFFNATST